MRTQTFPWLMTLAWFVLGFGMLGLSWYALTSTPYPGLWWGGLVVALVCLGTGAVFALAALLGWVRWSSARR